MNFGLKNEELRLSTSLMNNPDGSKTSDKHRQVALTSAKHLRPVKGSALAVERIQTKPFFIDSRDSNSRVRRPQLPTGNFPENLNTSGALSSFMVIGSAFDAAVSSPPVMISDSLRVGYVLESDAEHRVAEAVLVERAVFGAKIQELNAALTVATRRKLVSGISEFPCYSTSSSQLDSIIHDIF